MAVQIGRCLLKDRLKEAKLTQVELALRLGKSKQRISDYANNHVQMSLATCREIAQIVGCTIDDLYEWL
ncbi:helix-turn-helix transcriptional regulator [Brevibacillus formosus]